MNKKIVKKLMQYNVPESFIGFKYLHDAVNYALKSMSTKTCCGSYKEIANKYNVSMESVEKGIRYAIKKSDLKEFKPKIAIYKIVLEVLSE